MRVVDSYREMTPTDQDIVKQNDIATGRNGLIIASCRQGDETAHRLLNDTCL